MGVLDFVGEELARLEREELRRSLREVSTPQGPEIVLDGRPVLNFCSNDYLSLADHPLVLASAKEAMLTYGVGAGASRLIVGNQTPHVEVENQIADFLEVEQALLFSSGYHANTGAIPALINEGDVVFSDELNHASIIDGCRLSRAEVQVFDHNDVEDLARRVRAFPDRRCLVVVEGLYSMNGDLAPLGAIWQVVREHDAMLLVDEAHALGVLGERGTGACELADLPVGLGRSDPRILRMGTLGKALGSAGAFVAGDGEVIDFLRNRARSFIFTTALPSLLAAAAGAALRLVRTEPDRRRRLLENARKLRRKLAAQGWDLGESIAQILPLTVGAPETAMDLTESLLAEGVYVQGIRPPTVPAGTSRLRLSVCAAHTDAHIDRVAVVLARAGQRLGVIAHPT